MSDAANDPRTHDGPRDPRGAGPEAPPVPPPASGAAASDRDRPCPEYVPTRCEVEVLARYWLHECYTDQTWVILYQQSSVSDWYRMAIPLHAQASSPIAYGDGSCVMFVE